MRKREYCITDPEQAKALARPIRLQIVDRLGALGPTTVRELADALGRKPTAIYHHLAILEEAGLIEAEKSIGAKRGRPSDVYRAIASRVRLGRPYSHPELIPTISLIADQTAMNASRALRSTMRLPSARWTGAKRVHGFFSVVSAPSPKRLKRINKLLDELVELTWAVDEEPGERIAFTWFLSRIEPDR
jgi:DNA-binding transcriptional ArsR family regulator